MISRRHLLGSAATLGLAAISNATYAQEPPPLTQKLSAPPAKADNVPPLSLRRTNIASRLVLPSPYESTGIEMVHPSVVFRNTGWRGYNRWMAVTPYPGGRSQYENPCILASNDGLQWEVPRGVTNPVVPQPAAVSGGAYNSDPHLMFSPDSSRLLLLFRYFDVKEPKENLMLMESGDGIRWSEPKRIYTANSNVQRLVAPSMWWDGSQFVILGCDMRRPGNAFVRLSNGGSDPYTGWSEGTSKVNLAHPVEGGAWWHGFFHRQPNGLVSGLIQDGGPGGGNLYLADSTDNGENFAVVPFDLAGAHYRSCFVITSTEGRGSGEVYIGHFSPFFVSRAEAVFDRVATKDRIKKRLSNISADAASDAAGAFFDKFDRPDAALLETAVSQHKYAVQIGSFGISQRRAFPTTTGNNVALVDLGPGGEDVRLLVTFDTVGTEGFAVFRASDAKNYWRIGFIGGGFSLQKIVADEVAVDINLGTQSKIATTYRQTPVEVLALAETITVLMDGEPLYRTNSSSHASQTRIGLQSSGAAPTFFSQLAAEKANAIPRPAAGDSAADVNSSDR